MKRFLFLLPILVACGTPRENCVAKATRDQRMVERLITESEQNLKRGFAYEEITVWRQVWVQCGGYSDYAPGQAVHRPRLCLDTEPYTTRRAKAIDPAEENRKLAALVAKRRDLAQQAQPAIVQCWAQYPE
ncbi:MAG: hypothetical protein U1D35_08120 [Paracoccaceae bacterium]|nr:hypothetical protein [Paracoccaceae bacterium]